MLLVKESKLYDINMSYIPNEHNSHRMDKWGLKGKRWNFWTNFNVSAYYLAIVDLKDFKVLLQKEIKTSLTSKTNAPHVIKEQGWKVKNSEWHFFHGVFCIARLKWNEGSDQCFFFQRDLFLFPKPYALITYTDICIFLNLKYFVSWGIHISQFYNAVCHAIVICSDKYRIQRSSYMDILKKVVDL